VRLREGTRLSRGAGMILLSYRLNRWQVCTRWWLAGRCGAGHQRAKAEAQLLRAVLEPPVHLTAAPNSEHPNGKPGITKQG